MRGERLFKRNRKYLAAGMMTAVITGAPALLGSMSTFALLSVPVAHADQHGGNGGQGRGAGGAMKGQGSGGGHAGTGSQRLVDSVLRGKGGDLEAAEDEDSDRPEWAGGGGKGDTGKPVGAGTNKGDLYGDLYVLLRDDNGEPELDEFGRVQFLDAEGNVIAYASDDPEDEGFTEVADAALLQEVEFGRTNIVRAPDSVVAHALEEAMSTIASDADGVIEYDEAGRIVVVQEDGTELTIDSPLENLALYLDAMTNTETQWTMDDAATFLAAASSKTGTISVDMVIYLNTIMGINNPEDGYYDLTGFTYDRGAVYTGDVTYLTDPENDGTYVYVTEPIMDAVFDGETYEGSAADGFAQAADDAVQVIEFIHEPIH